ncbi:MAG: hypothetical protein Fues2KO_10640 [Fuerstiella sp.]
MKPSLLFLLPALVVAGCSSEDTPGSGSPVAAAPSEDSAEATVQYIVDGLQQGQPVVLWNSLPESYQSDVNDIVHTFGENMDPQVWTSLTTIVKDVHKLLVDQKQFIVNHPDVKESADKDSVGDTVDQIAGLLDSLLAAAGDLEKLKTFDGGEFLSNSGADMVQQFNAISKLGQKMNPTGEAAPTLADLQDVKVETVTSNDETATLKIISPDGKEEITKWTKTEGKWLPTEMVEGWDQSVSEAKAGLAGLQNQEQKAQMQMGVMMASGMISGVLAPLQNAKSQEDFNQAVAGLQQSAGAMIPGMGGMGGPPAGFDSPPPSFGDPDVTVEGPTEVPETTTEEVSEPKETSTEEVKEEAPDEVNTEGPADTEASAEAGSDQ